MIFRPFLNLLLSTLFLFGCAGGIQKTFWGTGTAAANDYLRRGDYQNAEQEYRRALWRAKHHLGKSEISDSLYNMGSFYAETDRFGNAIEYLKEALELEETLTGSSSERTGRRIAALAFAYSNNGDWKSAQLLSKRLQPLVGLYSGKEREFVEKTIAAFDKDPEIYKAEINKLKPAAKKGDPQALYDLATYYEDGRGVSQDRKKAVELYETAAKKDHLEAQYYLGVIYGFGRGVAVDDVKARRWFKTAAERGHKMAQYNYAILLFKGLGGPVDEVEAKQWMEKSSAQGYSPATTALKSIFKK